MVEEESVKIACTADVNCRCCLTNGRCASGTRAGKSGQHAREGSITRAGRSGQCSVHGAATRVGKSRQRGGQHLGAALTLILHGNVSLMLEVHAVAVFVTAKVAVARIRGCGGNWR